MKLNKLPIILLLYIFFLFIPRKIFAADCSITPIMCTTNLECANACSPASGYSCMQSLVHTGGVCDTSGTPFVLPSPSIIPTKTSGCALNTDKYNFDNPYTCASSWLICDSSAACITHIANYYNTKDACDQLSKDNGYKFIWINGSCRVKDKNILVKGDGTKEKEIVNCEQNTGGTYYFFDSDPQCIHKGGTVIATGEKKTTGFLGVTKEWDQCFCGSLLVGQSGDYILHKPDACSQDADGNTIDIHTAIGCIPVKPEAFVKVILNWAIGIAGGIAFMFMLFSAFQILASRGNPEALKAAQEQLTAAVIGLLFIIFSVFLLRIIGVPIMNIGG